MLNSHTSISNLEISILDSLRPERVRELAEEIFPELRDISGALTLEERDSHALRLRQRLSSGLHRSSSASTPPRL